MNYVELNSFKVKSQTFWDLKMNSKNLFFSLELKGLAWQK